MWHFSRKCSNLLITSHFFYWCVIWWAQQWHGFQWQFFVCELGYISGHHSQCMLTLTVRKWRSRSHKPMSIIARLPVHCASQQQDLLRLAYLTEWCSRHVLQQLWSCQSCVANASSGCVFYMLERFMYSWSLNTEIPARSLACFSCVIGLHNRFDNQYLGIFSHATLQLLKCKKLWHVTAEV